MKSEDIRPSTPEQEQIIENKALSIGEAILPVIILVAMLACMWQNVSGE